MNGAQYLVKCLEMQEVKYIFGIPGAKVDAIFDALEDSPIELILCRHEQNAAFMAACYGRLTRTPGVVLVTSGPGVSNLTTGLLTATTEGDPIVAIGGNVPRAMRLKASHQSADNVDILRSATKFAVETHIASNIPEVVSNAFRIASMPRSGATFISFPQDILSEQADIEIIHKYQRIHYSHAPSDRVAAVAAMINKSICPVLLLGLEASRKDNTAAIRQLLMKAPLATVSTYQAAGVISHELIDCFVGRVGLFKNQPGDELLEKADLVITIGYNPVEYDPESWNARNDVDIIHIDYNPADIHTTYQPKVELLGDIADTVQKLTPLLTANSIQSNANIIKKLQSDLYAKIDSGAKFSGSVIHPLRFIYDLRTNIDDNTIVISDIGTHYMWLARYFLSFQPHKLLFSNGQQTLGVALPWAMATQFVNSNSKVISISGDGGFLFSAMELETAVRCKLNITHFVWCDGSYDMVREQQVMKYKRDTAVEFGHVDLVKFAESFGATGMKINDSSEIVATLNKAMQIQGPVIIEVPIDYSHNQQLFLDAREHAII